MSALQERITELWEKAKDEDYRISQAEFAAKIGATRNQLRGWLTGAGEPDSEMLIKISDTFKVSVDWLVGNTNEPTHPSVKGALRDCDRNQDQSDVATLCLSRADNPDSDFPEEALKQLEEYKELLRLKYKIKKPD